MRLTWDTYIQPETLAEALRLLTGHGGARVVAGGTDVLVELSRDIKPTSTLIDISRIAELRGIRDDGDVIELGALSTHNDVIASPLCVEAAFPLAQACLEIGAPQLRTRATIAGNLVTASPANDTISPLIALNASLVLTSCNGSRTATIGEFLTGFRATALRPGELITAIRIPRMAADQRGLFYKLGLRRAQAISVLHGAMLLAFDGGIVTDARIALGCVAPLVVRAETVERFLVGRHLDRETAAEAGRLVRRDVAPIDDIRGTATYRLESLDRLIVHSLRRLANADERTGWPERVVLLDACPQTVPRPSPGGERTEAEPVRTIETTINGRAMSFAGNAPRKTLLDLVRDDAGLTGAKEGCAEGECGACTVWLDGQAVMSCLVPAAQARGRRITTIEGLANDETGASLHPLQQAFIDEGAVQCGFCIPGMIMAGAKLLDECPAPTAADALTAVSGNICRCTGYRKILAAIARAAETSSTAIERQAAR